MKQILFTILILSTFTCFGTFTKVARVIDGDTFVTEMGDRVRLVGINAPEASDIFGKESTSHLIELIEGKTVELVSDHTSKDRDIYNRLLRYVILNGIDVNKQMVLDGYAFAYLKYAFDKEAEYKQAQLTATDNSVGIWFKNQKLQKKQHRQFEKIPSNKTYLVVGLTVILILFGCYYYFKR